MKEFLFKWDEESIDGFWNMYSSQFGDEYFSYKFGNDILRIVRKYIKIEGNVLDFGCGPGYLLEKLKVNKNAKIFGADLSAVNVELTNKRLESEKNFCLCEKISEDFFIRNKNKFDIIFLIECLEHIMPEKHSQYIENIKSLLAERGRIIITVPNKENLKKTMCVCPSCGAVFHRFQHLTQWNPQKMDKFMQEFGFKSLINRETAFTGNYFLNLPYALAHKYYYGFYPNLLYIGQKVC